MLQTQERRKEGREGKRKESKGGKKKRKKETKKEKSSCQMSARYQVV